MIEVDVREARQRVESFSVCGHAGYGDSGMDIVCAAVSALVYNAVNSCEVFLGVVCDVMDDDRCLTCRIPESSAEESVQLLFRSMLYGIEQTSELYPDFVVVRYLSVEE